MSTLLRDMASCIQTIRVIKSCSTYEDAITLSGTDVITNRIRTDSIHSNTIYDSEGNLVATLSDGVMVFENNIIEPVPYVLGELSVNRQYVRNIIYPVGDPSDSWAIVKDTTNSFSTDTYTFTSPVSGVYQINAVLREAGIAQDINIFFRVNDSSGNPVKEYIGDYQTNDAYHRGASVTLELPVGYTLQILFTIVASSGGPYTFTGYTTNAGYTRVHNHFTIHYVNKI